MIALLSPLAFISRSQGSIRRGHRRHVGRSWTASGTEVACAWLQVPEEDSDGWLSYSIGHSFVIVREVCLSTGIGWPETGPRCGCFLRRARVRCVASARSGDLGRARVQIDVHGARRASRCRHTQVRFPYAVAQAYVSSRQGHGFVAQHRSRAPHFLRRGSFLQVVRHSGAM